MPEHPTNEQAAPPHAPTAAGGWRPQRGDLAADTSTGRTGVVVSLPEDSGTRVYHLRPEGGGPDWSAHEEQLAAAPDYGSVETLLSRVLGSYARKPGAEELARFTAELLVAGADLLTAAEYLREEDAFVDGALRDWRELTTDGPSDGALGDWNHARGLARVIRTLHRQIEFSKRPPARPDAMPLSFSFGRMS